jgi:hypothetical protein
MTYKKLGQTPIVDLMLSLKQKAPDLFEEIAPHVNFNDGTARISQSLAQKLDDWLVAQEPPYRDTFHEETEKIRVNENKRIREEREAQARLQQYVDEQGLLDNEYNANSIAKFIQTSNKMTAFKGRFTPQSVDLAIEWLRASKILQWRSEVVAPPPAAKPTVERLPNGEERLPSDTTNAILHRSSKAQVKDWIERKRQEPQQNSVVAQPTSASRPSKSSLGLPRSRHVTQRVVS